MTSLKSSEKVASARQTFVLLDDHEAILGGTLMVLRQTYPNAQIITEQTSIMAWEQISSVSPSLVVMDLCVPEKDGSAAKIENGIKLLQSLLETYPELNIVVQSAHVKTLVRLKPMIDKHHGGFTVADKSASLKEMLKKVSWALEGVMFTPRDMRNGLEVKPEWLQVLELAYGEGLQDKAIAKQMNIAERTVRHYWTKVQDALEVYPEQGKNIRIQTQNRAREEGLID